MLDNSPQMIDEKERRFHHAMWQLRTPLTGYRITDRPYGLDNGCFSEFRRDKWLSQLQEAKVHRPVFVCLPDIVGSARRTLELWPHFLRETNGLPRALVLQDGIGQFTIPWRELSAVFIGGSDEFKISPEAFAAARTAKYLGKWVHVGRVNTAKRVDQWIGLADSLDGSGISRFDHMLRDVVMMITGEHPQRQLEAI